MSRTKGKSARMLQVERHLLAQREPIPQAEVARVCGVNRSTINRMLADLQELGVPIYQDDKGRIAINRDAYLTSIRLTLDESMAVFLAARLLARYSDKPNPHAVEALLKLGLALEQGIAPQIGRHITRTSEALRERHATLQHHYLRTLETLTKAWSMNYKVRIVYRPLRAKRPFEHTFAPYFLEPSAIGYGTYAIGWAEVETSRRGVSTGKIRTRKVERIESISLLNESFEIPADFDPVKLLSGAWGIWFDEEDQPTSVVLRFNRNVARRVRESKWHPSEKVEEDTRTGDLIWRAEIDEWQEIVPWVRQWGADVEALEPKELRETLMGEAKAMAEKYGWFVSSQPSGKSSTLDDFFGGH
ncbi:MAG: WYL domain-containing protein [Anaerolineae bacterium]|nr:WYL domain-containing protein [Anaerolineae bacterium]